MRVDSIVPRMAAYIVMSALLFSSFAAAQVANPLKPDGVTLGMSVAEAGSALSAAGYETLRDCLYRKNDGSRSTVTLHWESPRFKKCDPEATVQGLVFQQLGNNVEGKPVEIIGNINKAIGGEPSCSVLQEKSASCRWNSPPDAPHIGSVHVMVSAQNFRLALSAPEEKEGKSAERLRKPTFAPADSPKLKETKVSTPSARSGLAIEGVYLGMTRQEARDILLSSGYKEHGSYAVAFSRHDSKQVLQVRIDVTYSNDGTDSVSAVRGKFQNSADYDEKRQELVARFGSPDSCTAPGTPIPEGGLGREVLTKRGVTMAPNCTWTREEQGRIQTLNVTFGRAPDPTDHHGLFEYRQ